MEQYSPEWWAIRALKMTSYKATAVGNGGKGLDTYTTKIVTDSFELGIPESYTSDAMAEGTRLEPEARAIYELVNDCTVTEVGFITNPSISEYVGVSPDGEVHEKKGLEIKCLSDKVYQEFLENPKIISCHKWQMEFQMLVAEYDETDYHVYNPRFKQSHLTINYKSDDEKRARLLAGIKKGEQLIKEKLAICKK